MKTTPVAVSFAVAVLTGCSTPAPDAPRVMGNAPDTPAAYAGGCNRAALQQAVLQRVNEARAAGQSCTDARQAPVRPVQWNAQLGTAALRQADDMARRDYLNLRGPDGTRFEDRVHAAGYDGRVGPVLAAGDYSPDGVVRGWLASPAQCTALMNPAYSDIGAGCASRSGTSWGHYWAVVVGRGSSGTKAAGGPPAAAKAKTSAAKPTASTKKKARKPSVRKAAPRKGCSPTQGTTCR
jgi:uncharacterized protein YkwD